MGWEAVMDGLYEAVVADPADPLKKGRVRLIIPQVSAGSKTGWAVPSDPELAKAYRLKRGTIVWAYFDGGSRSHPVYVPPAGALLVRRVKTLEAEIVDLKARVSALGG